MCLQQVFSYAILPGIAQQRYPFVRIMLCRHSLDYRMYWSRYQRCLTYLFIILFSPFFIKPFLDRFIARRHFSSRQTAMHDFIEVSVSIKSRSLKWLPGKGHANFTDWSNTRAVNKLSKSAPETAQRIDSNSRLYRVLLETVSLTNKL